MFPLKLEAALAVSAFLKTHSYKLIPNWARNCMITYANFNGDILYEMLQEMLQGGGG